MCIGFSWRYDAGLARMQHIFLYLCNIFVDFYECFSKPAWNEDVFDFSWYQFSISIKLSNEIVFVATSTLCSAHIIQSSVMLHYQCVWRLNRFRRVESNKNEGDILWREHQFHRWRKWCYFPSPHADICCFAFYNDAFDYFLIWHPKWSIQLHHIMLESILSRFNVGKFIVIGTDSWTKKHKFNAISTNIVLK